MLAAALIIGGAVVMLAGVVMLVGWTTGKSRWFDAGVYDSPGARKTDRQFLYIYFMAMVLSLLLGGAIMIVFGLRHVL